MAEQPDAHDPGDPHDETCRCGLTRWRYSGLWWCATCDGRPRPDQIQSDPEALPPPAGPSA